MLAKKFLFITCCLALCTVFKTSILASDNEESIVMTDSNIQIIEPYKIDFESNETVDISDYWEKKFKTSVLFGEDHNSVDITITQVSGNYKLQFFREGVMLGKTDTFKDTPVTWTWNNLNPDKEYKIKLINSANNKKVSFKIQIKSFKS